jgi:hypothetical protein
VTKRGFPTRLSAPNIPSVRLPEKATRGLKPVGCERYVPMPACFGKGQDAAFFDFMTAAGARTGQRTPLAGITAKDEASR